MFNWIRKFIGAETSAEPEWEDDERPFTDTIQLVTVWAVVDHYLQANPAPTPHGVHALIEAGAANLLEPSELLQACEKIQEHGYQYPINPTLQANLTPHELLAFIRWQSTAGVGKECYEHEGKIYELIERFRLSS